MARLPIGCEAPCEPHWLAGRREEEAVSRVTRGQGAAAVAAAGAEKPAGVQCETSWRQRLREAAWEQVRVPLATSLEVRVGWAAGRQDQPGESLLCNWMDEEKRTWDALGWA